MIILVQQSRDSRERLLTVGYHSHIGLHVLVNLTTVDIKVDNLRLLGVGLQITRHSVRESHTDGNEYIALLFLQVDGIVAVHTQHSYIEGMV